MKSLSCCGTKNRFRIQQLSIYSKTTAKAGADWTPAVLSVIPCTCGKPYLFSCGWPEWVLMLATSIPPHGTCGTRSLSRADLLWQKYCMGQKARDICSHVGPQALAVCWLHRNLLQKLDYSRCWRCLESTCIVFWGILQLKIWLFVKYKLGCSLEMNYICLTL